MKVLLLRHTQTNYNVLHLVNSDPSVDVHLTKAGIKHANELAEKLKETDFKGIFISELARTKQTADIINKYHRVPVTIDARLNDNRSGYEGRPTMEYIHALNASPDKWTVRLRDGESLADVKARITDFIQSLHATPEQSILIVTSEIIIQTFYGIVKKLTFEESFALGVDNGSYIELEI